MLSVSTWTVQKSHSSLTVECMCCIACNQIHLLCFNFVLLQIKSHTIANSPKFIFLPKATRIQYWKTLGVVRNLPLRYCRNKLDFNYFFFKKKIVNASMKMCISFLSDIPIKDIQLSIKCFVIFLHLCFPNIMQYFCKYMQIPTC